MAWELIFMLLLLKIPLFYLCGVVWYAIKAEPVIDDGPGDLVAVREPRAPLPPAAPRFGAQRGPARGNAPIRRGRRVSRAGSSRTQPAVRR